MTTLTNLSVAFNLNAKGVVDGSKLARNEIRQLQSLFRSQATDSEKVAGKLDLIEKAYRQGAIGVQAYTESKKRLNASLKQTDGLLKSATGSLAGYVKGLAVAYISFQSIRKVASGVDETIDRIDALSKQAKVLGESVSNLQEFAYAMDEMAGIDVSAAENMLQTFVRNVGKASLDTGKAKPFLQVLGLDANTLSKQLPTKQFDAVIDKLRVYGDESEKLAIATALFGDEGAKLLPILNETKEAWAASAGMVDKLGLAISDIEAQKLEDVNDALDRATKKLTGVQQLLTVELADAIADTADAFVEWKDPLTDAVSQVGEMVDAFVLMGKLYNDIFMRKGVAVDNLTPSARKFMDKRNKWDFGIDAESVRERMEAARIRGEQFDARRGLGGVKDKVPNPFKTVTSDVTNKDFFSLFPMQMKLLAGVQAATTAAFASGDKRKFDRSQTNTLFDVNSAEYQKFLVKGQQDVEEKQLKELQEQKMIWKGVQKATDVMVERLTEIAETRIGRLR